ncbi:MAG: SPOR domain-containing protein [Candidatus Omnitrophica bacterium]|nr:SPOR domain-containing protein [Candidatus Omnitrophota bacterium]
MLNKTDNSQLELFSESEDFNKSNKGLPDKSWLSFIWGYEKTILIILGIVTISIISYSLGIERGRHLSILRSSSRLDIAALKPGRAAPVVKPERRIGPIPAVQFQNKEILAPQQDSQQQAATYIIQLASYKSREYAQREAQILKRRGFSPLILSKGNYIILCIGNFPKKETAQSILSGLKKQYNGCYIRRL